MEALRLPKTTSEEIELRTQSMQAGLKKAIEVPLSTMRLADSAWNMMLEVAKYGNIASKSDVEVGAKSLETGIWGAHRNVLINIEGIKDENYKQKVLAEANSILERAKEMYTKTLDAINSRS
jgi:glutamate formiminotransferase/formiminotetrahydrofolate cyclodeaminase